MGSQPSQMNTMQQKPAWGQQPMAMQSGGFSGLTMGPQSVAASQGNSAGRIMPGGQIMQEGPQQPFQGNQMFGGPQDMMTRPGGQMMQFQGGPQPGMAQGQMDPRMSGLTGQSAQQYQGMPSTGSGTMMGGQPAPMNGNFGPTSFGGLTTGPESVAASNRAGQIMPGGQIMQEGPPQQFGGNQMFGGGGMMPGNGGRPIPGGQNMVGGGMPGGVRPQQGAPQNGNFGPGSMPTMGGQNDVSMTPPAQRPAAAVAPANWNQPPSKGQQTFNQVQQQATQRRDAQIQSQLAEIDREGQDYAAQHPNMPPAVRQQLQARAEQQKAAVRDRFNNEMNTNLQTMATRLGAQMPQAPTAPDPLAGVPVGAPASNVPPHLREQQMARQQQAQMQAQQQAQNSGQRLTDANARSIAGAIAAQQYGRPVQGDYRQMTMANLPQQSPEMQRLNMASGRRLNAPPQAAMDQSREAFNAFSQMQQMQARQAQQQMQRQPMQQQNMQRPMQMQQQPNYAALQQYMVPRGYY